MGMHVHELHAAAVHAPLVLLPGAALVDTAAAISGSPQQAALGRKLWWLGVGAAAMAGLSGLAASQETKSDDRHAEDMMWLHGIANFGILLGATGIAIWRAVRRPSLAQAAVGLAACGVATYTAYLGGEMVYGHGVGVRSMPSIAPTGVGESPPVLSARAPATFLRDVARGLGWLLGRTARVITGRHPFTRGAFGVGESAEPVATIDNGLSGRSA